MGPWFIRDGANPFRPGCSFETVRDLIKRGKVTADTILRGPTTRQYWNFASRTPGIANLLGQCHNCHAAARPDDYSCAACGAVFTPETDRQHMGLAPIHLLPGQAAPEIIAAQAVDQARRRPVAPKAAANIATLAPVSVPRSSPLARGIVIFLVALIVLGIVAAGVFRFVIPALEEPPLHVQATAPEVKSPEPPPVNPAPTHGEAPESPAANPAPTQTAAPEPANPAPTEPPPATERQPDPEKPAAAAPLPVFGVFLADPFDPAAASRAIEELRKTDPGSRTDALAALLKERVELIALRSLP